MEYLRSAIRNIAVGLIILSIVSCAPSKKNQTLSSLNTSIVSGDIVISNSGSKDVKVFDSNGNYKMTLLDLDNTSGQAPYGLAYDSATHEILVAIDSTTNRKITAIDTTTLQSRDFSASPALNGSLRGIDMLPSGDLLVVVSSGNRVEKISGTTGTQINTGGWPKTSIQTTPSAIKAGAGDSFTLCSTGSDVVRTYDSSGTQTATASSGITGTTDVMGCTLDSSGNVFAVFNGTTDTIRKYNPSLNTVWSYSNTVLLPYPTGIAVRSNGNVLVLDQTNQFVVEISADGSSATILGGDTDNMLNTPQFIMIVP